MRASEILYQKKFNMRWHMAISAFAFQNT